MIEKIDINDASIAEAVRKQMSVATSEQNGLMAKTSFVAYAAVNDANIANVSGIYVVTGANIPTDYTSYMILAIVYGKYIKQLAFPNPSTTIDNNLFNRMYVRYGIPNGEYSPWKLFSAI